MNKSVMILALGDIYWTKFAAHFSQKLIKENIPCVIVLESRAGEYQSFLKRAEYANANVYYLTDYVNNADLRRDAVNCMPIMSDYLRVEMLGQKKKLYETDWNMVASCVNEFTQHVMENENIGLIIGDQVSTSLSYNFCEAATRISASYWGLAGSRLSGRHIMSKTIKSEDVIVGQLYEEIVSSTKPISPEEKEWAGKYLVEIDSQVPDYMRSKRLNNVTPGKFFRPRFIKSIIGSLLYTLLESSDNKAILIKDKPLNGIITAAFRNFSRWSKVSRITKYLIDDVEKELSGSEYYIFPIHYQPEASTVVASPRHSDQLNLIKNLAFSMPAGTKLVVKEHVSNIGFPDVEFYKAVKSYPNVILASHNCNIKELIRNSLGVITITSTAGFEALLLNKHVYYFGDVFYTYHPNAIKLDAWAETEKILSNKNELHKFDNIAFLVAYKRYTYEGRIDFERHDFSISDGLLNRVRTYIRA